MDDQFRGSFMDIQYHRTWLTINNNLCEVARDLWIDLEQRFSMANGPRIQELKSAIANCRQQGQTVLLYFGRLKKHRDKLATYEQIQACKCQRGRCNILAELNRRQEEERSIGDGA